MTRCNNISELALQNNIFKTSISDESATCIIENLKTTLEKLDLSGCRFINPGKLFELQSMKKLKVFCYGLPHIGHGMVDDILFEENLKKQLPNIIVNPELRSGKIAKFGRYIATFTESFIRND